MSEIDFKTEISNFVFTSKYARYNEKQKRRETWSEACDRVSNMHLKKFASLSKDSKDEIKWAFDMVKEKKVVPSMRSMQFGGPAVEAHNSRIYNCSVRHMDSLRSFSEVFYLLLCGCGVGIGLSKFFLDRLPNLVKSTDKTGSIITYTVEDNIEGWSDSLEALLSCYFRNTAYTGRKIIFDYSKIRKKGAPLKTGGGKAPGYEGLKNTHEKIKALLDYIIEVEHVERMRPIHAYDLLMHASDAVLSGGVRRSACSVVFDKTDDEMLSAKTYFKVDKKKRFALDEDTKTYHGIVTVAKKTCAVELSEYEYEDLKKNKRISWVHIEPQRARSNNSVLLMKKDLTKKEFDSIIQKTREFGEPGFVFANHPWTLFNPCFEISFIPVTDDGICGVQFCNLSSINGAKVKTKDDFIKACKAASILGTLQASYTVFDYLSPASTHLTEDEALLGVSITGIMDNPKVLTNEDYLQEGSHKVLVTNRRLSKLLGIKESARLTCVKPEGTSSLVLGSASGIHPHHALEYFRRMQCNKLDTVYQHFKKSNPHMCEESVWSANKTDDIITFPLAVSEKAILKEHLTALKHLKIIKKVQENWVLSGSSSKNSKPIVNNVSCTVIVKDNEWDKVIDYIYNNREYFGAVALLSDTGDKDYKQAPLEAVKTKSDRERFEALKKDYTSVDYTYLKEHEDKTKPIQTVVCSGGKCDLIT